MVDMHSYVNAMMDKSLIGLINATILMPAANNLFAEGESEKLNKQQVEEFFTFVAKDLFLDLIFILQLYNYVQK